MGAASNGNTGAPPHFSGLQVRLPDGLWLDCPPMPDTFVVNAGDLIQVWTNDAFLSNRHRVINPPPGDASDSLSVVFFAGPHFDATVECLPACCSAARPARYPAVSAREHLEKKLRGSGV
eukprot:NODE_6098_length_530_cov_218.389474.p1 GENE.NODE_6098_length_530_cov_218.389474~~NODE_6098_length_530_cov_218.389474.p1  ORF type:complete len:120 (+),score=32.96 NODE_6098_length_530_cov_218.389474:3-362(+)